MTLSIQEEEKIVGAFKDGIQQHGAAEVAHELKRTHDNDAYPRMMRELNINDTGAKWGLLDAVNSTLITGDMEPWKRIALRLDHLLIPIPKSDCPGYNAVIRETGKALVALADSMKDGKISAAEREKIEKEITDAMSAMGAFLETLRARKRGAA